MFAYSSNIKQCYLTYRQSGPGSDGNEGVFCIPQSSSITGATLSDCLMSYPRHSLGGGLTPLQKCCYILLPHLTGLYRLGLTFWQVLSSLTNYWGQSRVLQYFGKFLFYSTSCNNNSLAFKVEAIVLCYLKPLFSPLFNPTQIPVLFFHSKELLLRGFLIFLIAEASRV